MSLDIDTTPAEERARELANAFTQERIDGFFDKLNLELRDDSPANEMAKIKKQFGIAMSVAYFHGYMARERGEKVRKLYI